MRRFLLSLVFVILGAAALAPSAQADIVNFDSIPATCCYSDVAPGTGRGPVLVFPGVTFNGGVVMNNTGWANLETSPSNLYGTSDFLPLHDGSLLPGIISAVFSSAVTSVRLDVINGLVGADFTMTAFGAGHSFLGSTFVSLADYPTAAAVGSLSLSGLGGIYSIEITSGQGDGDIDFAIDTVEFTPVPEPGTLVLIGTGLATMLARRRRRG
jgi:hypothetical protein